MLLKNPIYFVVSKNYSNNVIYIDEFIPSIFSFRNVFAYTCSNFDDCEIYSNLNSLIVNTFLSNSLVQTFKSNDRGETWALYSPGYSFYCYNLVTPSLWYACTNSQVYYSTNAGSSWSSIGSSYAGGIPVRPLGLFLFFQTTTYVIIHSNGNAYKTSDFSSWSVIASGIASLVAAFFFNSKIIIIGSPCTRRYSNNYGSSWSGSYVISVDNFNHFSLSEYSNNFLVSAGDDVHLSEDFSLTFNKCLDSFGVNLNSIFLYLNDSFFGLNTLNFHFYRFSNYGDSNTAFLFTDYRECYPIKFLSVFSEKGLLFNSFIVNEISADSSIEVNIPPNVFSSELSKD